jgi:hypothetical protein
MTDDVYPKVNFNLGRPLKFTPTELAQKFDEYVQWCKDHPIVKEVTDHATSVDGTKYGKTTEDKTPRLVSIGGFLVFLGETWDWWSKLETGKHKEDFFKVKGLIRGFCEEYQKEMASANVFNGNIISRLLGLADKAQVEADVRAEFKFKFGE